MTNSKFVHQNFRGAKMKKAIITVILTLLMGFGHLNQAQNSEKLKDMPAFQKGRILKSLNLSEEQLKKVEDFRYEHQSKMIELKSEFQKNRLKIHKMMSNNEINSKDILDITAANNKLQGDIKTSFVKMWIKVYEILDKDQQKIWTHLFNRIGEELRGGHRSKTHGFLGERSQMLRQRLHRN